MIVPDSSSDTNNKQQQLQYKQKIPVQFNGNSETNQINQKNKNRTRKYLPRKAEK